MPYKLVPTIKRNYSFFKYNVKPFKPAMVGSHIYKRLKSKILPSANFRIIDLAITYKCNLFCEHCSAKIMERNDDTLTLDDYRNLARQASKLDNLSWNITGGEPLLVDWLDDLISILTPKTHFISVQTNCMLLSREKAEHLAKIGVNCITTSLDSCRAEEHNRFRGHNDSYERVINGVRNARRAGMQVLIAGTVTHQNIRSEPLEKLIQLANKNGAIFLYNLAVPCGEWKDKNEFTLRDNDREHLYYLLNKYPRSSTDHEVGRNEVGCPAGMEKIYITPYGDVLPCPFIHISFGNILHDPLDEIINRMRRIPEFGGYPKICVAAEDKSFHEKIFPKIYSADQTQIPIPYDKVFTLD